MGLVSTFWRGIEKRATKWGGLPPRDPVLAEWFGAGGSTSSSVNVTESVALSGTAVLCAVRTISEAVGMLPLDMFVREVNDDSQNVKRRFVESDLYWLLKDQPNPLMTSTEWRGMMQGNALMRGNAYSELVRDGNGEVKEIWPLDPRRMRVVVRGRRLIYEYGTNEGTAVLMPEQVLHIQGFSLTGVMGLVLYEICKEAVGASVAQERFAAGFFANGAMPSGVLTHPGKLSKEAREGIRKDFVRVQGGLTNAQRVAVFAEGMTWAQSGVRPDEAQMLESRQFSIPEISRIFNVTPDMLMDLSRATFSNVEEMGRRFKTYTIQPWAVRWEQRLKKDLLRSPSERRRFFFEYNMDALVRGDLKAMTDSFKQMRLNGVWTANDILDMQNRNPLPAEIGDTVWRPANMVVQGSEGDSGGGEGAGKVTIATDKDNDGDEDT